MTRVRPKGILRRAKELPLDGQGSEFRLDDRLLARVYWHDNGQIEREQRFDAKGRPHGADRERFEDGATKYLAHYRHGLQTGLQQQWDRQGRLLVSEAFVRGTGMDVWFDGDRVAETRQYVDGDRHGFERWWIDPTHVYLEIHFMHGLEHGVKREWNAEGRLRRGGATYWIRGAQVTRRAYVRACLVDNTLPPLRPRDDLPARPRWVIRGGSGSRRRATSRRASR